MATTYTYTSKTTTQGLTLHMIKTTPQQIEILDLNCQQTLAASKRYGINSGYFNMGEKPYDMLNLAMCDGQALEYRWHDCGWGFLSWNGQKIALEFATQGSEVKANLTAKGTWGQGGYRMLLGYKNWLDDMVSSTEATRSVLVTDTTNARSAVVGDAQNNQVYLISTEGTKQFSMSTFRNAIAEALGINNNGSSESSAYKGIILDGGGSTQFRCAEKKITTSRPLRQVMVLRDITG